MSIGNRTAVRQGNAVIFYITDRGLSLARRIEALYPGAEIRKYARSLPADVWKKDGTLIFIMAAGIVVRTIASLIKDKKTDPAVIVLDESGQYAVSLLSGHLGGANEKAKEIAGFLGGEAVITTASDLNKLTSIDIWARDNDLVIEDWKLLPRIGTLLVNKGRLPVYSDFDIPLPPEFVRISDPAAAGILITNRRNVSEIKGLYLRPKNIVLGIGCNSGTSADEIESAVRKTLDESNLSFLAVGSVATINIKADEPGVRKFCGKYTFKIHAFTPEELNRVEGVSRSEAAFRATGAKAVAEPAALLAAGTDKLLIPKQKIGNVTVAATEKRRGVSEVKKEKPKTAGKIFVVGTGPGDIMHITPYAQQAIRGSDIIIGYGTYVDLIKDLVQGKEVFSTGMTQEIDRCRKAVELSCKGKTVSVISGGDPGIYAMAGLVFELLRQHTGDAPLPAVEVIPGISALNACAARLGAPLMHDFASISLSDRLTPWDTIEKRLDAAAMADFVIILYNPKSKGRTEQIGKAREIVMKYRAPDTPVGLVRGAMRENEVVIVTDLRHMLDHEIDMQTSVVIGNTNTFVWNNMMITPRGYEKKRQFVQ